MAEGRSATKPKGGINDVIGQILCLANEQGIPIVFATSRRRLALTLKKSHKVGCVGVFSYDGAEGHYKRLMELVEEAKDEYQRRSATHLQTETRGLKIESSPNGEAIAPPSQRDEQDLLNAGCDDESDTSDSVVGNETDCSVDLRSTPWSIFFTQNTSSTGNSPRPLITGASPKPSSEGIAPKPSITGATTELTKEGNSPKYLTNFPHGHSLTTQLKEERGRPKFGRHARASQEPSVHFSSMTSHTLHTNDSSLLQLPPTVQSTNISPYGHSLHHVTRVEGQPHHVTRVEGQPRHVDGQPTNFNISATEFVPSWTLNIHAQEFTPSVATET